MERRKFEDSFQDAFRDAEMTPSESVWTNIELDLERANGDQMKRRLFFFKTLAAASIVFALCVGGLGYYIFWDNQTNTTIAQKTDRRNGADRNVAADEQEQSEQNTFRGKQDARQGSDFSDDDEAAAKSAAPSTDQTVSTLKKNSGAAQPNDAARGTADNQLASDQDVDDTASQSGSLSVGKEGQNKLADGQKQTEQITSQKTLADSDNNKNDNQITSPLDRSALVSEDGSTAGAAPREVNGVERKLPSFYEPVLPELQLPASTADPGMVLLARLADEEKKYATVQKGQKSRSEKLWTSVGFAAGAFNANSPNVTPPPSNSYYAMNANSFSTASKQSKASGISYSLGVSLGTNISDRWVLQGGINYLTQSSDYTANSVIVMDNNYGSLKAESLNVLASQNADMSAQPKVAQTFPYNVNNSVRFVSVPLQAGYLLVNKKFGVQLNAGISTDLFLQNTITPDGGGVTKTTQGRGDDSPYRSLNFSGLMGTELSYKLGSKYRVSVNPGLRYPFNSVYKANTGIDAMPLTFDVGLRFRYIFH